MSDNTPKRRAPAFPLYADDFLAGTADMSAEEVGGYIRLLCHQWTKGGLPNDPDRLARMAGLIGSPSLGYVVAKLTLCEDGLLRHPRIEAIRAESDAWRAKQAASGASGAAKRWGVRRTDGKPNGDPIGEPMATLLAPPMANGWPKDSSPSPSPSPLIPPNPQGAIEQTLTLEVEPAPKPRDPMEGFSLFWQAYPKKQGRTPAEKAWRKLQPDAETVREIVEHVQTRRTSEEWTKELGQFIPLPSTFLNQKRWTDETRVAVAPTTAGKSMSTEERILQRAGLLT